MVEDEKAFTDQLNIITSLQSSISKLTTFDGIREALQGFEFVKLPTLSKPQGDQKAYHTQIKDLNNQNKTDFGKLYSQYFSLDEEANINLMAAAKSGLPS